MEEERREELVEEVAVIQLAVVGVPETNLVRTLVGAEVHGGLLVAVLAEVEVEVEVEGGVLVILPGPSLDALVLVEAFTQTVSKQRVLALLPQLR